MILILNSLAGCNLMDGFFKRDGSESAGTNDNGEFFMRGFINVFSGKIDNFEFSNEDVHFQGKLIL